MNYSTQQVARKLKIGQQTLHRWSHATKLEDDVSVLAVEVGE